MEASLSKLINKISQSNSIKFNRKLITFVVCFVLASFFWLISTLSKEYNTIINFPISYINLPRDKVLANHLQENIDVEIKASGFSILRFKIYHDQEPLNIDALAIRPLNNKDYFYLTTNSKLRNLSSQLGLGIKIIKVSPDTLYFNFSKKISKRIPVKINLKMSFEKPYALADSVKLVPDSVLISGAGASLDKIKFIETEKLTLLNLNKTISRKTDLLLTPEFRELELSPKTIMVRIPVAKFTEGSLDLPIEIENLPPGFNMKIFPDKVKVTYLVSFDNYEKISPALFQVAVDYLDIEKEKSNKLKVKLRKSPLLVKAVKINSDRVEYILRK